MLRILYLAAYFHPEHTASSYLDDNRFQAFGDAGIHTCVYTPLPTRGIDKETRKQYKKKRTEILYNHTLVVHRFSLMGERKNPFFRFLRYLIGALKQFYMSILAPDARSCNLILVSSTPPIQGALAGIIKKIRHIPVVYNLQDIFPDSLVAAGLAGKRSLLWRIGRKIEDFSYRNADKIIVISEDFKRNIMAKGVPEEKIEIIPNWVDDEYVFPIERSQNPIFDELGLDRKAFYIVYAGNLGEAQNIQILLDCALKLKNIADLKFLVFGNGGLKEDYLAFVRKNNLTNVSFFPLQPQNKVSQVYSIADAALIACKKGFGGCAMPSKTWNILATGTPVLCSFDKNSALQHIIEGYQLGVFSESENLDELLNNILILRQNPEFCKQCGANGRKYIEKHLTKKIGTTKYIDIIREFDFSEQKFCEK